MFRKTKPLALLTLGLFSALSLAVKAEASSAEHIIVAPSCLMKNLQTPYQTITSTKDFSLIAINDAGVSELAEIKHHQNKPCGGFKDVSRSWKAFHTKTLTKKNAQQFLTQQTAPANTIRSLKSENYSIQYTKEVNQMLTQLNPQNMWTDLTTLTNFQNRYANSDTGVKAANWFKSQVETIAKNTGHNDVTVTLVDTGLFYKQPSVVAKLGNSNEPGIVIGGHMDTLSGRKPGADDDGTGSVTTLEIARTLLTSGMKFKRPIHFIWYAAEEEGLVGSDYVVSEFQGKNIPVKAVIHFDMTGYSPKNDLTMWLVDDYVNKDLTVYLETLIKTYVKQPIKHMRCGYACSDHASWTQGGIPSAIAFESDMGADDPYIHTSQDTMEVLSLSHMTDYAKLGIAFAVELAEPLSA